MAIVNIDIRNRVASITFNRPESLNAINLEMLMLMDKAVADLRDRNDVSIVVLKGAGEKAFIAGADIRQMKDLTAREAADFSVLGQRVLAQLEDLPQITIAAVNGYALGGGFEVVLACDLVYASDHAKFGLPEVSLGVIPGFGGTQRLTRWIGPMRAREMVFGGAPISAVQAQSVGLVAEVFPKENFDENLSQRIDRIMKNGPQALRRAKRVMREGAGLPLSAACEMESGHFGLCFGEAEQKEGMAAFLEKRKANWMGS